MTPTRLLFNIMSYFCILKSIVQYFFEYKLFEPSEREKSFTKKFAENVGIVLFFFIIHDYKWPTLNHAIQKVKS